MKYQLSTFGGENIILEDQQYEQVLSAWDGGADEFSIGDRRIPRKAISYLGFTKEAAEQFRIEESEYERSLPPTEAKKLREAKKEAAMRIFSQRKNKMIESGRQSYERRWKSIGMKDITVKIEREEERALPMSEEESEAGCTEFWIDDDGVKHYD